MNLNLIFLNIEYFDYNAWPNKKFERILIKYNAP